MSAAASYEQAIQNEIRLELGNGDCRLFRNNTGCLRGMIAGESFALA